MCRPAASLLSPGVRVTVVLMRLLGACLSFTQPVHLGSQTPSALRAGCLGSHVSCESPLSWGPRCGIQTLRSQGRAGSLSSLPAVCYCYGGRLMVALCLSHSLPFPCWFSVACCEESCNSILDFLLRELLHILL